MLTKELAKRSWRHEAVALGTNTDPYQRAEGRYQLMPGIIAALADSGTPFSILTKGNLLRRDLPLLVEASAVVPVDLAMTIAIHDDELQRSVEPGAPTTASRLETVRAIRNAGLEVAVFMMPVLPYLTDSRDHLERAVAAIKAAGASTVLYHVAASAARRTGVVLPVAGTRASRARAEVPRDVRARLERAERLPALAVGEDPAGHPQARPRRGR